MANRYFNQFKFSFDKMGVELYLKATIGASGAPTIVTASSKGITSITRNSAGKYTIVLNDTYVKLKLVGASVLLATGLAAVVQNPCVVSETVATAATKNVVVQFVDFAGAAADIDSGAILYLKFELSNSTAP